MDGAQIEKSKERLNKIVDILSIQINFFDVKIKNKDEEIQAVKLFLIKVTENIVELEAEIEKKTLEKNKCETEIASLNNQKSDLTYEVKTLEDEANGIKEELKKRTSVGSISLDLFNHLVNPFGAAISDVIRELTDSLKSKLEKMEEYQKEIERKQNDLEMIDRKVNNIKDQITELNNKIQEYKLKEDECDVQIKELGENKTNLENLKSQFESFKNMAVNIIDRLSNEKDLIDLGIDVLTDVENDIKSLFKQNNLEFPNI